MQSLDMVHNNTVWLNKILIDAVAASISLKQTRTSWKLYCLFPKTGYQYLWMTYWIVTLGQNLWITGFAKNVIILTQQKWAQVFIPTRMYWSLYFSKIFGTFTSIWQDERSDINRPRNHDLWIQLIQEETTMAWLSMNPSAFSKKNQFSLKQQCSHVPQFSIVKMYC